MKVQITFKTPYATDAVEEHVRTHCKQHDEHTRGCAFCADQKVEAKYEIQELKEKLGKFIMFDELVTIEFDTDTGTATVLPARK